MNSFVLIGQRIINLDRISSVNRILSKEFGSQTTVEMGDPSQIYTVDGPEGERLWQFFLERAEPVDGNRQSASQ